MSFEPSHDRVRTYYDSMSLDSTNERRKRIGLAMIDKLGGFTYADKKRLRIQLSPWEHDGYKWFQILPENYL